MTIRGRGRLLAWWVLVNILITACLLEIALRAQQKFGPLVDLDISPQTVMVGLSDELNHAPTPGDYWDRDLIRQMDEPNTAQCNLKLLFLGDSFMQGLGKNETVPYHVRSILRHTFGKEICVLNAGYTSYSPSIFVPQAKKLIPQLGPDIIVVDIDETDVFDDYYRYRELVRRDEAGSIVAVRPTPLFVQFSEGLVESTRKPLYLHRLLSKLYFTRIVYPRMFEKYYANKPADIFWLSRSHAAEARQKYSVEIEYFKATLEDLTQTILSRTGRPDRLIYVHHPHLEHLKTSGEPFNDIVSNAIGEVASRHKVRFYDATEDLKREFEGEPEKYYIPNDMHFNPAGLRAYGAAVAKYLAANI